MTQIKFLQCNNSACNLRLPIDLEQFSGNYCPRCGGTMEIVADWRPHPLPQNQNLNGKRSMVVILDNVRSAYNVGAIFRTSDGIGVEKLVLCGITPTPDQNQTIAKTALGAEEQIKWEYQSNALHAAQALKADGYQLIGLENTPNAILINNFDPGSTNNRTITLVVGNEKAGVDPGIIEICEAVIFLPMAGKKASLNVTVAFGAAAYWLSFA